MNPALPRTWGNEPAWPASLGILEDVYQLLSPGGRDEAVQSLDTPELPAPRLPVRPSRRSTSFLFLTVLRLRTVFTMTHTYFNQPRLTGASRGLPSYGLIAVIWAGFILASVFLGLRCFARLSETRKLFADDYWMLVALFFLLVNAILQTVQTYPLYYLVGASLDEIPEGEALLAQGGKFVYLEFITIGLFRTIIWCVKASFLTLYWRLFESLPACRRLWWAVAVFAALAYVGCWISSALVCHPPSAYFHFGKLTLAARWLRFPL